ncbi:hypothetical protein [Facklamia hominis]|uniref:Uncharacterized protein n=2 Tax=Facklamia hominis TaxID=178214 RepID=K1LX31_9LACT|nr:hypothetical protein [Facklamia hominis]EKB54608.1 hypothetical protein HMPREF9706_00798 [Facklamia hominis CCUG 36813]EPH11839.1 hypothetical protein HMPREF9260_00789 [Facklamia hominis ACS-120-V-Sch10]MDK7187872.1 hypothetical protein [Facklamia hominis]RYC97354.1 hypothetical protein EKN08_08530 [Facklamia hominis]WPJ91192.1 hypothetical protein R0V13_02130 [Facklamia hominis]
MNNRHKIDEEKIQIDIRYITTLLVIALFIQIVILALYYFKEKQVALAFPMVLGIFVNFVACVKTSQLGK